jgi:hypothetical protein
MTQQTFKAYDEEIPRYENAVAREEYRVNRLKLKKAVKVVNEALWKMGQTYHDSWPAVVAEIRHLLLWNGFEDFGPVVVANEGRFTRPIGRSSWISISYYVMSSGRWEVTAYVS